ncbi:HNH endonuclease [Candidatus Woesearchaeota archaeon]|nr:HNH endonuclease [Candidatus Woesearchaeota archaeon]
MILSLRSCRICRKKTYIDNKGYVRFKDSNILVHRYNAEKDIRKINPGEEVHHVDGDKLNNHSDNLIILSKSDHEKIENERRILKNLNIGYLGIILSSFLFFITYRLYNKTLYFYVGLLLLLIGAILHEYPYELRKLLFSLGILNKHNPEKENSHLHH